VALSLSWFQIIRSVGIPPNREQSVQRSLP
jgi:hypothetical protein